MSPPEDILVRLDAILAELLELRGQVAALVVEQPPAAMPKANGLGSDDFGSDALIEISTAVERYGRPADSLRWMCRHQGLGIKIGGVWKISVPRLRRYLGRE